jgi:hypothetical protein
VTRGLVLVALWAASLPAAAATESQCRAMTELTIRVRFAGEAPREVVIESNLPSGFRLLDSTSREELWSTGPDPARTQQFASMDAGFGTSFAALHLDADGVHDRLYAGDRAGRLWRFDLRAGARPAAWIEAALLADLRAPGGGRGFVARPDVALIHTATGATWLNIAIGTANTGAPRADHRFYVLRDSTTERPGTPLLERDLELLSPPAVADRSSGRGYYLQLGSAQVLAQALTLNGLIHFTVVEIPRNLVAACRADTLPDTLVPLSVTVLRATDGALEPADAADNINRASDTRDLRRPLATPLPASAGVELAAQPDTASGLVPCRIAAQALPGCSLDTRPRRSWWRREDAD